MNFEGVRSVGEIFGTEFKKIGFQTRWIDMKKVNRAGHLFAEHKAGKPKGKRILLIGHLDTVFEKAEHFQPFEKQGTTRAIGQGVNDMKGGDVIALFALKALNELGLLKNTQIIVAFHGDEESSGDTDISRKDIIEAAKQSDVALGYETCEGMATATIARRGISGWTLHVEGNQAHSSLIFRPDIGGGAIFEASRILHSFYQELAGEQYLTFNPGLILGGTEAQEDPDFPKGTAYGKTNVISKTVIVDGDLRFISNEQKEKARARMRKIVETNNIPKTSATIEFSDGYPSMPPTDGNRRLLKMLDQVSRDLNLGPVEAIDPSVKGAADVSFVAPYVDCMDGLGAMGNGGHTPKEDMDLTTFIPLIQRSAVLIYRLINETK
jgi:glutamate carboxypeptidase